MKSALGAIPGPVVLALRVGFVAAIVAYLVYCLFSIGWVQLWHARPGEWMFYALLPVAFLVAPVADIIIYRRLWGAGGKLGLPVIVRKNVLNNALFDLSGETYLVVWARKRLGLAHGFLFHSLKDNLMLAAIAGWGVLLAVLAGLTATGNLRIPFSAEGELWVYATLVCLLLVLCAVLFLSRQAMAVLSNRQIVFTFAVHGIRVVTGHGVMITLWCLALPSVSLVVWLNFLLVRIVVTRLGFLPSRDLLALGAGLSVAGALGLPQAAVAAMLLAIVAAEHLFNLLVLSAPGLFAAARTLAAASRRDAEEDGTYVPAPAPISSRR